MFVLFSLFKSNYACWYVCVLGSFQMDQIIKLKKMGNNQNLLGVLKKCCDEEIHHQEDAGRRIENTSIGTIKKLWISIIKIGSEFAVKVSAKV